MLYVESIVLADRNLNVPCESGIRYPSLVAMLNRRDMSWQMMVYFSAIFFYIPAGTLLYVVYMLMYMYAP